MRGVEGEGKRGERGEIGMETEGRVGKEGDRKREERDIVVLVSGHVWCGWQCWMYE